MSAQWVLSGLIGAGCVYALDITVPAGKTQIIFVTSFPFPGAVPPALTHDDADAVAGALHAAVLALPGGACALAPVTFNGMKITEYPGAVPADLAFPAATWANYAAIFGIQGGGGALAGMICASPADGVLTATTLVSLAGAWAAEAASLPGVITAVSPVLQVILPASVI